MVTSAVAEPKRRNLRLRRAIQHQGLTMRDLASTVNVDLKTVQRWCYEGRLPRANTRERVAGVLRLHSEWLWPTEASPQWAPDLTRVYVSVKQVPSGLWTYLARTASRIDIACDNWGILGREAAKIIMDRTATDATVRWTLGDPSFAILRFDTTILVCLGDGPVLHLTRVDGRVFDLYSDRFQALWTSNHAR